MEKIRVGISACLLGEKVRYDGGHKLSPLCVGELAEIFDFVPVCPEVGIGMGVPRQPIRLVGDPARPRALGVADSAFEVSAPLREFGRRMAEELRELGGYVFIQGSPSCGLHGVKVFGEDGRVREAGRGLYAAEFTRRHPRLPVEEAGTLEDPARRAGFIAAVRAYHAWRQAQRAGS